MRDPLQLRRFAADTRGSIALYMAAALLPLALMIGAATDLRRIETERVQVQDAADAAVLAGARAYLSSGASRAERLAAARAAAEGALRANLADGEPVSAETPPPGLSRFEWTLASPDAQGEMVLTVQSRVPLAFGGLFRMSDIGFQTRAAATPAVKNLELALVLDNTGSMGGAKIRVLRDSTVEMIEILEGAAELNPDKQKGLRIALVPFSMTVRLPDPASYRNAPWMRGRPAGRSYDGLFGPTVDRFEDVHDAKGGWKGCVEVRPSNGDHDIAEDVNHGARAYAPFTHPGSDPNAGCSLTPLKTLSNDTNAVKAAAKTMTAVGNTNVPLGLIWGWHTLSPDGMGPFGDGTSYGRDDTVKAVLLMTDGDNQINWDDGPNGGPYSGIGVPRQERIAGLRAETPEPARRALLDARLTKLCAAMKARGVKIYTVRVIDGNESVLRACASRPEDYFYVRQPGELRDAFGQIAGDLVKLRLTQ